MEREESRMDKPVRIRPIKATIRWIPKDVGERLTYGRYLSKVKKAVVLLSNRPEGRVTQ